MALPDSNKVIIGTIIVLADSATHSPNANFDLGTRTDQIDMTSLAAGLGRQSTKVDFTANMDVEYVLAAVVEWATNPTAGETVDFYMGWSSSASSGVANSAGLNGVDADYAGYANGALADSLKQLHFLGSMSMDLPDEANEPQIDMSIATFSPRQRYGQLVVVNSAASVAWHDAVETSFSITPLVSQVQD